MRLAVLTASPNRQYLKFMQTQMSTRRRFTKFRVRYVYVVLYIILVCA